MPDEKTSRPGKTFASRPDAPRQAKDGERATTDTSRSGALESLSDARQASDESSEPKLFGRYRILKTLGQGAMGAVFLAEDTQLRRQVALKIPKFTDSDQTQLDRFYREARSAAALRHPNICPVHDVGEIDGSHYLTMAYIEGKSLADVIKSGKAITERQAAGVVRKVALGLTEAHAQGVIHRDLKPANIMIDRRGEPIVTDFGLARQLTHEDESRLTQTGAILGTPAYMSPEQVEAGPEGAGPASDVYSLGVILYELLSGQLPFRGAVTSVLAQIVTRTPPRPSELREGLDPALEAICLKAMARKVDERYASMSEFAAALAGYLQRKSPASPAAAEKEPSSLVLLPKEPESEPGTAEHASFRISRMGGLRSVAQLQHELQDHQAGEAAHKSIAASHRRKRDAVQRRKPLLLAAAGAGLVLLLGIVIFLPTPNGTIKIELSDPTANVEVRVDGETVSLTGLEQPLQLKAREHELVVTGPGFETVSTSFTVKKGENPALVVSLVRKSTPLPEEKTTPTSGLGEITDAAEPADSKVGNDSEEWITLFNGRDLSGWSVAKGHPSVWTIKDGDLIGTCTAHAQDNWLLTDKEYGNFALRFEYRMWQEVNASAGITFRAGLTDAAFGPVKLMDDANRGAWAVQNGERTGSLWAQGKMTPPSQNARLRAGWNEVELVLNGKTLTLSINGDQIQSVNLAAFAKEAGTFPTLTRSAGRIGLQANTSTIRFRNLRVRELPSNTTAVNASPTADAPAKGNPKVVWQDGAQPAKSGSAQGNVPGWADLFNGRDLTGWTAMKTSGADDELHSALTGDGGWKVQDRTILCTSSENGWLRSKDQYGDFVLHLEFKVPPDGNSDVFVRCPDSGHLSRAGTAIQIIDDRSKTAKFQEHDRTGAIWRVVGPSVPVARPAGEWNSMEIRCEGDRVQVTLNDSRVVDADMNRFDALRSRPRSGFIGLSNWHGQAKGMAFRNIRVSRLDGKTTASAEATVPRVEPAGEWLGEVKVLQRKSSEWQKSKTDYGRSSGAEMEVGMGNEAPGWGWGASGIEVQNVRRLSFNFAASGKLKKLDDASFAGFKIDYRTAAGYTKRVAFSTWDQVPSKPLKIPGWGTGGLPADTIKLGVRKAYDFELERWAPPGWDGHIWFTLMLHNAGNGTKLQVRSLKLTKRQ